MWLAFCVPPARSWTWLNPNHACHFPSAASDSAAAVEHLAEAYPCCGVGLTCCPGPLQPANCSPAITRETQASPVPPASVREEMRVSPSGNKNRFFFRDLNFVLFFFFRNEVKFFRERSVSALWRQNNLWAVFIKISNFPLSRLLCLRLGFPD